MPQPPVRQVEARAVLGVRRLLRRHPAPQRHSGFFGHVSELTDRREMTIPGTERVVQAHFLDGSEPRWKYKVGPRVTLADWMTSPDNPYFARAAVNRTVGALLRHRHRRSGR